MNKSRRYQLLVKLEKLAEQKSLHQMVSAQQALNAQRATGRRLNDYLRDYSEVNSGQNRGLASVAELRNASRFVQNLAQAIDIQQQREKSAQDVYMAQNQQWLQAHSRQQSMHRLSDHYYRQEQRQQTLAADQENEDLWLANRYHRAGQPPA